MKPVSIMKASASGKSTLALDWSEPRTACAIDVALVLALLATARVDLTAEKATQAEIETLLLGHIPADLVSREHRLGPGDIPDFVLGGQIVVEVKGPRHRQTAVYRQLERYAGYPDVVAIILATSRAMTMPRAIGGKPCHVLNLGKAWL